MLTDQDRNDITNLINLHGHHADAGDLDRMCELFTPDITHEMGSSSLHGTAALKEAALALGDANPVGHHVTNIVITGIDDHTARVRSKGIGIMATGTTGSVVYDDIVTRRPGGWKISHRKISMRRRPLGNPGPREVLERWRQAAIDQSAQEMTQVYAADAVHEFPFTRPGLPSRLDGRDEILRFMTAVWDTNTFKYDSYRTLAIHDTGDPNTIVVEQEAIGTAAGEFVLPNLIVLTARDGQVAHLRDYVNILAAEAVVGSAGR